MWSRTLLFLWVIGVNSTYKVSHPKVPGLQTVIGATSLKDCWVCTHGDIHSEEKVALVAGPIPLNWWVQKPRVNWCSPWISTTELAWRPTTGGGNRQTYRYQREWKRNWYSKGVPEYEVETLIGQNPICIENKGGPGPNLGEISYTHCAHTWSFDKSLGEFTPRADDHGPDQEECDGDDPSVGKYPGLYGGEMTLTSVTLFNFTEGHWREESKFLWKNTLYVHDRLGILINKTQTKHDTCDSKLNTWESPFWTLWLSITCAHHKDPNVTLSWFGGRASKSGPFSLDRECGTALGIGERRVGPMKWETGDVLTLSLLEHGMYWLCGKNAYKALPQGWNGRCAPAYLAPKVEIRKSLNASEVLNMGSFLHRLRRGAENPLVVRNTGFHQAWRAMLPGLGVIELEIAVKNISKEMEKSFNSTLKMLMEVQQEVDSLSKVVVQNRKALDILAAQQGGACALIGEKCCYYVNNQGKIDQEAAKLKESIQTGTQSKVQPRGKHMC
ncbi:endogenous retroviral envelope protein HEMO-like [Hemicordylus capensis]|uniref:endogenous retroviral envelope protein HEMO-like n=1 Tax=Hemicordylus capensis TaxID=884348 RepID=UPI00230434FD|nr:endogenous retroviral envelope protein HEMO-like [Hemicordylus capensis]